MMRLLFLLAMLVPAIAYAQEPAAHPIDKALDACLEKNLSTAGMVECIGKAYESWDRELNKNYGELSRKLPDRGRQALKASQLEWIQHRDAEFKFIDALYSQFDGTMYIPMRADSRLQVVKKRALELANYLEVLKEHSQ